MQASKKVNFYLKAFIFYLSCNYYTSEEIRKDKQVKHIEKTCLRPSCNCEPYKKFEVAICLKKDLSLKSNSKSNSLYASKQCPLLRGKFL